MIQVRDKISKMFEEFTEEDIQELQRLIGKRYGTNWWDNKTDEEREVYRKACSERAKKVWKQRKKKSS